MEAEKNSVMGNFITRISVDLMPVLMKRVEKKPPKNPPKNSYKQVGVLPAQLRMKESKTFSLSIQPLTALAQRSYGERDFAKAEVRKTEKKEGR